MAVSRSREIILRHLEEARRHVQIGERHVEQQREIIAKLERDGHDATEAKAILKTFLETQRLHEEELARVSEEATEL